VRTKTCPLFVIARENGQTIAAAHRLPGTRAWLFLVMSNAQGIPYTVKGAAMKSIQLPDDVYQRAAEMAEVDHVSVDRLVAALVNEGVGDWARVQARAERGSRES
jgi:hypothetical protein